MSIQTMMLDLDGPSRLRYLDGLRAVAVLSVVVFHCWTDSGAGGPALLARICQMGAHGVDLFFVLSGFCLAYPYLRRYHARGSADFRIAAFAAKRITRIVPPYWLALVIIVVLGFAHIFGNPPPLLDIVKQLVFFDRDVQFVTSPFWTLPVEFRWYFLFPLVLLAYVRAPRFVLLIAVGSYLLHDFTRLGDAMDFGMLPAFLAGIWIADLHLTRSRLQRFALPAMLFFGVLAFAFEPSIKHNFFAEEPLGVFAVMAFAVLAGTSMPLQRLLAHPMLVAIGTGSYGIYLIHDQILWQLEGRFHFAPWLAGIAAVLIALGFSWLCERPFVKGRIRDTMVRALEVRAEILLRWLGIPDVLTLAGPPSRATDQLTKPLMQPAEIARATAGKST
jgi:peptidoglycan/LPS O-acetylase OafA/YrhL